MQVKMNGRKGTLCDSTITLQLPQILPFCICFSFKFGFVSLGGGYLARPQSGYEGMGR